MDGAAPGLPAQRSVHLFSASPLLGLSAKPHGVINSGPQSELAGVWVWSRAIKTPRPPCGASSSWAPRKHKLAADRTCPSLAGLASERGCPSLLPTCNLPSPGIGVTLENGGQREGRHPAAGCGPIRMAQKVPSCQHLPGTPVSERTRSAPGKGALRGAQKASGAVAPPL